MRKAHFPIADRVRISELPAAPVTEAGRIAADAQVLLEQSLAPADRQIVDLVKRLAQLLDRVVGRPNG